MEAKLYKSEPAEICLNKLWHVDTWNLKST